MIQPYATERAHGFDLAMRETNESPEEIYLQVHGDGDPTDDAPIDWSEVTWSAHRVFQHDVKYVVASVHEALRKECERLYDRCKMLEGGSDE